MMELNFELGIIFDTIKYFEIYFNYNEFVQHLQDRKYDMKEGLKYYKRIKKNKEFSYQLQAFFDLNKNKASLLINLFSSNIREIRTLDDYLLLLGNKNLILGNLIDFYFENISPEKRDIFKSNYMDNSFIENFFQLNIKSSTNVSLVLIFKFYDEIIDLLIDSIKIIYFRVKRLHELNKKFIYEFELKENYLNALSKIIKINAIDNAIYGISFIDSYSSRTMYDSFYIFGNLYEDALDNYKFINVTFNSVCETLTNELNAKIIDFIYHNKKACVSDIEDHLIEEPLSSIYRAVTNLYNEKVIERVENKNGKYYYSLNSDYFENSQVVFKNKVMYYVNKN